MPACTTCRSAPRTKSRHPQLCIRWRILGTAAENPPGLLGVGTDASEVLDRLEALGVFEVASDAQHLAQVGRADEQQVDVGNRGDVLERRQCTGGLDLDAQEGLGVGPGRVLGERSQAEPAVAIAAVQPALAPWPKLGPAHGLLGLRWRADHADHHSACSGLEGRITVA